MLRKAFKSAPFMRNGSSNVGNHGQLFVRLLLPVNAARGGTYSAIPFYFATCHYPFQLYLSGVDATVRNAVNLVYLWLARCRSRFMRDVLHQSVELSSLFFTDCGHAR